MQNRRGEAIIATEEPRCFHIRDQNRREDVGRSAELTDSVQSVRIGRGAAAVGIAATQVDTRDRIEERGSKAGVGVPLAVVDFERSSRFGEPADGSHSAE